MSYSLQEFCHDARSILKQRDDHHGRDQVRQGLEALLRDRAFCAEHFGPGQAPGVRQIHQDPDLGFCVLVYNMTAARSSPPHDHGDSWAVYGQAAGHTDMTVWSVEDGAARPVRSFRLEAGQAALFDVGDIHAIEFGQDAKFARVTGRDLSAAPRRVFDPETGAVRHSDGVETRRVRDGDG